jgi:hypothetical protein
VTWQDWVAAVELAAQQLQEYVPDDAPIVFAGYSCGGALVVQQTIASLLKESSVPTPDALVLFSPAIGITPLAATSNWHKLFTWLPGLKKNAWLGISLEVDPYKYVSFTKNAGAQMYYLSQHVQRGLAELDQQPAASPFPTTVTFQSLVDSTIRGEAIVEHLYSRLRGSAHRLVIFDINHAAGYEGLLAEHPQQQLQKLLGTEERPFTLEVVTNKASDSVQVERKSYPPFQRVPDTLKTELSWPAHLFSLSHIAVPIPATDPLYGETDSPMTSGRLPLGSLSPRGEMSVLSFDPALLLRLRYNPFYPIVQDGLTELVSQLQRTSSPPPDNR